MDPLILPKGCTISGEKIAIRNEGDVTIKTDVLPLSIVSEKGGITFETSIEDVTCSRLSAENGELQVKAQNLSAEVLSAQTATMACKNLTVEQSFNVHDSLLCEANNFKVEELKVKEGVLHLDGSIEVETIQCDGSLEISCESLKATHIKAKHLLIKAQGRIECERFTASDGVKIGGGHLTIKMVDSPSFIAENEVRGIVMLSTAEEIRAEGVRGFIMPNEFKLFSEQSFFSIESGPTEAGPELEVDSLPEESDENEDRLEASPADEFSDPMSEAEPEPQPEVVPEDAHNDHELDQEVKEIPQDSLAGEEPHDPSVDFEAPDIETVSDEALQGQLEENQEEDDPADDEQELEDDSVPQDEGEQPLRIDTADLSYLDQVEENPEDQDVEINSEDLPDLDFFEEESTDEEVIGDAPSSEFSLDFNQASKAPGVDLDESLMNLDEPEEVEDQEGEDNTFMTMEIKNFQPPVEEKQDAEEPPEPVEAPHEELPEIDSFDDYKLSQDPEEFSVDDSDNDNSDSDSFSHSSSDSLSPQPPPVPPPLPNMEDDESKNDSSAELEVEDEEDEEADEDVSSPSEAQQKNEDHLVELLKNILDDIKDLFPETDYPKFIRQIENYLDDRNFSILRKSRNREAVLGRFDVLDHPQISELARLFYKQMANFFGDEI